MRYLTLLLAALVLAACGSAPVTGSNSRAAASPAQPSPVGSPAPTTDTTQFLLASAAKDFHEHGPAGRLRFRDVRVGHIAAADGKEQYMLCGQFQKGDAEWMQFVTIKTSDYEQYIGGQGESFCRRPSIVWDTPGDLSSNLQSQLDSLH